MMITEKMEKLIRVGLYEIVQIQTGRDDLEILPTQLPFKVGVQITWIMEPTSFNLLPFKRTYSIYFTE